MPPLAVCVAGFSGAGKTSLLEHVVPALVRRGLRVGYLKASAHRMDVDRPGKDTDRLRLAGAASIGIQGRGGSAHFTLPTAGACEAEAHEWSELPKDTGLEDPARHEAEDHATRVSLWNLRSLFANRDLLLIEGMKASFLPKILVNRADNPRGVLAPERLRGVRLHLFWPGLPADWSAPAEETVRVLEDLLSAPNRRAARGVVGAVQTGGSSTRMGEDKACLPLRQRNRRSAPPAALSGAPGSVGPSIGTWCERAVTLLGQRCATVWVVGRIVESGGPELPSLRWPVPSHLDLRPGCGLLGGMETALAVAGGRAVLTLPCDLPELPEETVDLLLSNRDSEAAATVFHHPPSEEGGGSPRGRMEPAVAILEPRALEPLRRFLDSGERGASIFFQNLATRWVPIPPEGIVGFANLNTLADRRRYEDGG